MPPLSPALRVCRLLGLHSIDRLQFARLNLIKIAKLGIASSAPDFCVFAEGLNTRTLILRPPVSSHPTAPGGDMRGQVCVVDCPAAANGRKQHPLRQGNERTPRLPRYLFIWDTAHVVRLSPDFTTRVRAHTRSLQHQFTR